MPLSTAVCRPLPRALMSDGAREAAKLPAVVGLQARKAPKPASKQLGSSALPVNGHQQGPRQQPSAHGTAARPHNQNGAPPTHVPAEASLSIPESSAAGDAPRPVAQSAYVTAASAAAGAAAAAVVNDDKKMDDAFSSREQAASVDQTAEQVSILNSLQHVFTPASLQICDGFIQQCHPRPQAAPKGALHESGFNPLWA